VRHRAALVDAGMTWTEERIELLAKLWSEGLSPSQIAAELGGACPAMRCSAKRIALALFATRPRDQARHAPPSRRAR